MFNMLDSLVQAALVVSGQNRNFFAQQDGPSVNDWSHNVDSCPSQRQALTQSITHCVSSTQDGDWTTGAFDLVLGSVREQRGMNVDDPALELLENGLSQNQHPAREDQQIWRESRNFIRKPAFERRAF